MNETELIKLLKKYRGKEVIKIDSFGDEELIHIYKKIMKSEIGYKIASYDMYFDNWLPDYLEADNVIKIMTVDEYKGSE